MMREKQKGVKNRNGWMIPKGEKLSYFVGSGSYMTVHTFITTFLSAYLLMIGVGTTISAVVLLVLKGWDAVNDIIFGYIVDKVHFKTNKNKLMKWLFGGKYMPWFRIGTFVLPLSAIIMFTINTSAPIWLKVTQYAIGYILYDTGFTLIATPYNCMIMSMTNNMNERTFIQSFATLGMGIGSIPVAFLGTALVAGGFGYGGSAVVFAIMGIILAIPAMFLIKERNVADQSKVSDENKYTLKEMWQFLKKTKELFFFVAGQISWGMFYTSGYLLFLAYYIFGNANLSLIYMAIGVIPSIALIPFYPVIFKRVSKLTCIRLACILYFVASLTIYFMGPEGAKSAMGLHYTLYACCAFSYSFTMIGASMVNPDIAEIAKYRTGSDRAGIIFSINSFITKLVGSLVTSVSLLILGAYGYVSVTAKSFQELSDLNAKGIGLQTERALQGLWDVTFLFPAFGFGLAAIMFSLCKISSKKTRIMIKANLGEITREEAELELNK